MHKGATKTDDMKRRPIVICNKNIIQLIKRYVVNTERIWKKNNLDYSSSETVIHPA